MKQITILFIFSIISHIGYSQYIPINLQQKTNYSDLIVEGEILSQESFINESDEYIYTKNKLKITKLLKGKIPNSREVEIITRGGDVNGVVEEWTHLLKLKESDYGIFFLKNDKRFGSNSYTTFASEQGFLKFVKSSNSFFASDILTKKKSINVVYNEIRKLTKEKLEIYLPQNAKTDDCLNIVISPVILPLPRESTNLGLSISASMDEYPLYLRELNILINYNSLQLGENVISSGVVEIDFGNELSASEYELFVSDFSTNTIQIQITANSDQADLILIDNFLKELLHANINFPDEIILPDISISEEQIIEDAEFINPQTGLITNLNCVVVKRPKETVACPVISTISPKKVAAGVEDMSLSGVPGKITITGSDFGDPSAGHVKPHLSDVLFWDVDLGWFPAAELEYISWSDTKIEVRVPTMKKTGGLFDRTGGACTNRIGIFKTDFITGDTCTRYSADTLFVHFGMFNDSWNQTIMNWEILQGVFQNVTIHGGKRRNLVEVNGAGGYDLEIRDLYTDPAKNNAAKDQVRKALDVYRCKYKINVREVASSSHARVFRGPLPTGVTGTTMMRGNSSANNCNALADVDSPVTGFFVIINEQVLDTLTIPGVPGTFMFNISDTIPSDTGTVSYTDFQRTMLHELGHCFQLRHTSNKGDIMISGGIVSPRFNNFNRTLSANDDLGAKHIQELKKVGACTNSPMTDYVCSTSTNDLRKEKSYFQVFPNPTNNSLWIKLNEEVPRGNITADLIDLTGKRVYKKEVSYLSDRQNLQLPANLPEGVYILKLTGEKGQNFGFNKIIIQR